jgi:galactitol-specific phosphotransferase system IIB component
MAEKKLIVCACGAAINTSNMAKIFIEDYLEAKKHRDYRVEICRLDQLDEKYGGRKNMVVCWMGPVDDKFKAPGVQGLSLMVGAKKDKEALVEEIIKLMEENYTP